MVRGKEIVSVDRCTLIRRGSQPGDYRVEITDGPSIPARGVS
jgi:hypothetical protein